MKILFWIQTFYPANIDFTIRQRCFITLDPEFLLWIKVFTLDPKFLPRIRSYYSGSNVITLDPKLLLRIQSFSGSYISYCIVSKVFTLDPKLLFRIQCSYFRSKVFTSDPKILSTLIFRNWSLNT